MSSKKLVNSMDKSYFSEHRDYTMIMLMIDTGMRLGECSMLKVSDINIARRQISIKQILQRRARTFRFLLSKDRAHTAKLAAIQRQIP